MRHSEQKTNLIYLFDFFPPSSLSHPCNISAWLAAYVNGFCGGISVLGWMLGQGATCEDRLQNKPQVSLLVEQSSHVLQGK